MACHARPHTFAPSAAFECICGWHAQSTDIDEATREFDQHFRDIGYEFIGSSPYTLSALRFYTDWRGQRHYW